MTRSSSTTRTLGRSGALESMGVGHSETHLVGGEEQLTLCATFIVNVPEYVRLDSSAQIARRVRVGVGLYAAMLALAALIAALRGSLHGPTLNRDAGVSLALGLGFAAIVCGVTELLLRKTAWLRRMRQEFRSFVGGATSRDILILAFASSIAEESLFRGALQPWLGLWLTSFLFAAVHVVPTRALMAWSVWAGIVGLALGLIAQETNSLLGPLLAHGLINAINLRRIANFDAALDDVDHAVRVPALVGRKRNRSQG